MYDTHGRRKDGPIRRREGNRFESWYAHVAEREPCGRWPFLNPALSLLPDEDTAVDDDRRLLPILVNLVRINLWEGERVTRTDTCVRLEWKGPAGRE